MAIIPLPPKFTFSKVNSFKLQRANNTIRSRYTAHRQTVIFPFAVWMLDATLTEYDDIFASFIRSFLVQLEGEKNTFRLPVPGYSKPIQSNAATAENLEARSARATSLHMHEIKTATGSYMSENQVFLTEGDYFTIQDELKTVTNSTLINAQGRAIVEFQPPLRKSVAGHPTIVPITLQNPTCLMTAADDDIADWTISPPNRQGGRFEAFEAIP